MTCAMVAGDVVGVLTIVSTHARVVVQVDAPYNTAVGLKLRFQDMHPRKCVNL
jgi:hypothetical protein